MAPEWLVLVAAGALGAAFGSFLNVCVYRLPRNESLWHPPSRCPACDARIAWHDNVPIVGWLWLGGRCRRCRAPISPLYPIIEALIAVVWIGAAWYYGVSWHGVAAAVLGTILVGITLTDARHYVIPHEFTIGGLVLGLALAAPQGWHPLLVAAIGAAAGFAVLVAIAWLGEKVFKKEAMGGGDIWMMAMVGAFVGWKGALLTIFLGALLGTVIFVPFAWRTGKLVPFGVFLAVGAAVTFVTGDTILAWYLRAVLGR